MTKYKGGMMSFLQYVNDLEFRADEFVRGRQPAPRMDAERRFVLIGTDCAYLAALDAAFRDNWPSSPATFHGFENGDVSPHWFK